MVQKRKYTKAELKKLYTNMRRKGITDDMAGILIEHCYNQKTIQRTSGFYYAEGPDAVISWTDATRTFTITPFVPSPLPVGSDGDAYDPHIRFFSWENGPTLHRKYAAESIQLPDEEGLFAIYFDANTETRVQELYYAKNPTETEIAEIYTEKVIIAWLYWNATSNQAIYFGEERHGSEWVPSMHWWAHTTLNGQNINGLQLTNLPAFQRQYDGSINAHAQVGVTAGKWAHEDIEVETDAVAEGASWTVFSYTSAGTVPQVQTAAGYPLIISGGVQYNPGGNSLAAVSEGRYFCMHLFATNCRLNPVIAVAGRSQHHTAEECFENAESEVNAIREEMVHQSALLLGSVMYQVSSNFTNTPQARLVGVWKSECYSVTQTAHGFAVGDPIRYTGTTYVNSTADTAENSAVHGIVCHITDANNFKYRTDLIMPNFGLTPGKEYFLSLSGGMTDDPTGLEFVRTLGWVTSHGFKVEIGQLQKDTVETEKSVTGDGSETNKIKLVNDENIPGNRYYYGTDKNGLKGYHLLPVYENIFIVYNETELLDAWDVAVADVGKSATIYIGAAITLTANREFLRSASDAVITLWGIGNYQQFYIETYTFKVDNITMRNLAFRTNSQVYVTVDGHRAEFIDCAWRDEQYYSATFSNMKIAVRCVGTIVNNTGRLTFDNTKHTSATSYAINSGDIQPFIIENAVNWGTADDRQMYIEFFRMESVLNYDRFSRLLLCTQSGDYVPFKVTGDLTWYYHPDQVWAGDGYIAPHAELLKKGSVDDLRADYIPTATMVSIIGIDSNNKIRKADAGTTEFTPKSHGNEAHSSTYATVTDSNNKSLVYSLILGG